MATRGTYEFKLNETQSVFFYVHYDNYFSGAALQLSNSLSNEKADCTNFIKNNTYPEITLSHDHHSDAEYRYIISPKNEENQTVTAYKYDYEKEEYVLVLECNVIDFIKNNINADREGPHMLQPFYTNTNKLWFYGTLKDAEKKLEKLKSDELYNQNHLDIAILTGQIMGFKLALSYL